jgi:hypothetical protein
MQQHAILQAVLLKLLRLYGWLMLPLLSLLLLLGNVVLQARLSPGTRC